MGGFHFRTTIYVLLSLAIGQHFLYIPAQLGLIEGHGEKILLSLSLSCSSENSSRCGVNAHFQTTPSLRNMWSPSSALIAVRSNNEAVRQLEKGQCKAANHYLADALTVTRQALDGHRSHNLGSSSSSSSSSPPAKKLRTHDGSFPKQIQTETRQVLGLRQTKGPQDIGFLPTEGKEYVFHYAVWITEEQEVEVTKEIWNKIAGIIVFNLALSHHILGEVTSEVGCNRFQQAYLSKARRFYEHAYRIQMQDPMLIDVMTPMAILNNLASLHTSMGNEVEAAKAWKNLLSLLVTLTSASSSWNSAAAAGNDRSMQDALVGFVRNVCCLLLSHAVTAPAA